MFHGRELNKKFNHLHEHSLRIIYKDNSFFKDLLKKDNLFTVHHKNIQLLAIALFKVKVDLSNPIIKDVLKTRTLP